MKVGTGMRYCHGNGNAFAETGGLGTVRVIPPTPPLFEKC